MEGDGQTPRRRHAAQGHGHGARVARAGRRTTKKCDDKEMRAASGVQTAGAIAGAIRIATIAGREEEDAHVLCNNGEPGEKALAGASTLLLIAGTAAAWDLKRAAIAAGIGIALASAFAPS